MGRVVGLAGNEVPERIYLEFEPFTAENHKLTPSGKLNRPFLTQCYGNILEQLYQGDTLVLV